MVLLVLELLLVLVARLMVRQEMLSVVLCRDSIFGRHLCTCIFSLGLCFLAFFPLLMAAELRFACSLVGDIFMLLPQK
jgi:hypothetical protein